MNRLLGEIKVLIWDFDGTLYRLPISLREEIRQAEYQVIAKHTGWKREKVVAEFNKIYKVKTLSGTYATALLVGITTAQAAVQCERYINRGRYIKRDEKLIKLFRSLSGYTHYLLVNGIRAATIRSLQILGISPKNFREIVTSEIVGVNKPDPAGFRYILAQTGLAPMEHLMIGDRGEVDLVPAKKLGMKTCLVWGEEAPKSIIDISLPTVYDLERIL